jgi:hypothetical protein
MDKIFVVAEFMCQEEGCDFENVAAFTSKEGAEAYVKECVEQLIKYGADDTDSSTTFKISQVELHK